jgi:hypothetical protein
MRPGYLLTYQTPVDNDAPARLLEPRRNLTRPRPMNDLIFIALIIASYATTHLLIVGLAKLGRIE